MTHKEELFALLKKMGFNTLSQDEVDGTSSVFIKSGGSCTLSFNFRKDGELLRVWSDGDEELHLYEL